MMKIGKYHLDTLREVSIRLADLANSLPDNRISFAVELSSRPYSIIAMAYEWSDTDHSSDIVESERAAWYFDRDPEEVEKGRLKLLAKVSEWEAKYGVL